MEICLILSFVDDHKNDRTIKMGVIILTLHFVTFDRFYLFFFCMSRKKHF